VRCGGEEAIAKSWPDGQKPDIRLGRGANWQRTAKTQSATVTLTGKSGG
jgi:hypothetical protein